MKLHGLSSLLWKSYQNFLFNIEYYQLQMRLITKKCLNPVFLKIIAKVIRKKAPLVQFS